MKREDFYRFFAECVYEEYKDFNSGIKNYFTAQKTGRTYQVSATLSAIQDKVGRSSVFKTVKCKYKPGPYADFISEDALNFIKSGKDTAHNLRYEHIVCRSTLSSAVINAIKKGMDKKSTVNEIYNIFINNRYTAIVTAAEDKNLSTYMPKGWKIGDDPFVRYKEAGLYDKLINTQLFED